MKLRRKTLMVVGTTLVILVIILYFTSRIVMLNSYGELEEKDTKQNVERALGVLNDDIASLDSTNSDWSKWDDTFEFVTGNYDEYVDENIDYETLANLGINLVILTNSSAQVIFGVTYDMETGDEMPFPQDLLDQIYPDSDIVDHKDVYDSVSGIITLADGPMLISSQPILNNGWVLPIGGTLIFGRFLDNMMLENLAEKVHLSITSHKFNDDDMPSDFQEAKTELSENKPIIVRPLSEESVAGYGLVEDIFGNPAIILRADMPRDIYNQGVTGFNSLILYIMTTGIIFIIMTVLFLDKQVLSRLTHFSDELEEIDKRGDNSSRILVTGNDELSSLAIEINKMLAAQEHKNNELERSNKELEQFAYVVSHDIQEPLRMIDSYLTLIERRYKGKLDKEVDEFIGFAVDGAKRMKIMINDLLIYSRVGTRGKPFEPTDCNVAVENAMKNLEVAIEENKGVVKFEKLPTVIADESQMIQLFQNLISNAIKYHGEEQPYINISVKNVTPHWIFAVTDNGIGIDLKHSERIFQIFQRLHTRDEYSGTGIGLAVSKKIVERHGGRIWVESEPGKGSTFYFSIPNNGGEQQ